MERMVFFDLLSDGLDRVPRGVAAAAHPWPGNVRELRNWMERALALGSGGWITSDDLLPGKRMPLASGAVPRCWRMPVKRLKAADCAGACGK